ncbi:hypothetical protein ACFFIX_06130 [Metabacillus herbersteinensis]|uniref:Uncharacterized protein n=1 Tax=Metabacillus herbersteinensis TaxID=283816 RepID=A0ABV6GC84_9BACI
MEDKLLEDRLQKLKGAYNEIPTKTSPEKIINEIKKTEKPKKKRTIMPYVASFVGVLLLAGVLGTQLIGQQGSKPTNPEQIEEMELPTTAEDIEKKNYEIRGYYERKVDELNNLFAMEDVEQYGFVQEAKQAVKTMENRKDYTTKVELENYSSIVKEIIDARVSMPEVEYELLKSKVRNGEKISDEELLAYLEKLDMMYEQYFERWYGSYREAGVTDIVKHVDDLSKGNIVSEDEDYLNLVSELKMSGYSFFNEGEGDIGIEPDYQRFSEELAASLSEEMILYLQVQGEKRVAMDAALSISHEELGERIIRVEEFMTENPNFKDINIFKDRYLRWIEIYLNGIPNSTVSNLDGSLKQEVKENFEKIIKDHKNTETAKIIGNFYQEIEANNFMYNAELSSYSIDIPAQFQPSDSRSMDKYLLPLTVNMKAQYVEFKENGESVLDQTTIGNSIETMVTRFYMYAVETGDYDTAYSLLYKGEGSKVTSRENYIEVLKQAPQNYQQLSNEVVKLRTDYINQDGSEIDQVLTKKNSETVTFKMKNENGIPKVVYPPLQ